MRYFLCLLMLLVVAEALPQCSDLGQNGSTAFPVCGNGTFEQTSVPVCGNRQIPTPCLASGAIFQDKNPFWYKFTCFKSGTFAFELKPLNQTDDYDWQIFDITGRNPADVYTDASLFVACNWSGEGGNTGASPAGTSVIVCEGLGKPLFSKMPTLVEGHQYIMLVSHFTDDSQSGYSLSFGGGGTSSITDPAPNKLNTVRPACDGKTIIVSLNKKVSCRSLAADGSDFSLVGPSSRIISAAGVNCNNGFDMDSVILTFDNPLVPGNYELITNKGADANTLLDYCDTPMAEGIKVNFSMQPLQPTPFDSITAVKCAPGELQLVFSKPILCNSVAANGSDFTINSSSGVSIVSAGTTCNSLTTGTITLKLSKAVETAGVQTVTLVKGSDGNTIVDECLQETPAGSSATFVTADTVSATINYSIAYSCIADTVRFFNEGGNGVNKWLWKFNERASSTQKDPMYVYSQFGAQQVRLTVSNGVCTDSSQVNFVLDNELKAAFSAPTLLCPEDQAIFKDSSIGKIVRWQWDFGNGTGSTVKNPPIQNFIPVATTRNYLVTLIIEDNYNCLDTATRQMKALNSCYIAVPSAFTPNGDGLNEYLYPTNAFKAANLTFRVYNRLGQVLFETRDFTSKWDGTFKGVPQATGTYVWTLQYTNIDTGRPFFLKGTSVLIR